MGVVDIEISLDEDGGEGEGGDKESGGEEHDERGGRWGKMGVGGKRHEVTVNQWPPDFAVSPILALHFLQSVGIKLAVLGHPTTWDHLTAIFDPCCNR